MFHVGGDCLIRERIKKKNRIQDSPALLPEVCEPMQVHLQNPKNHKQLSGRHDQNLWRHLSILCGCLSSMILH